MDSKIQQLLVSFQEKINRADQQALQHYMRGHFSGASEHPVCRDQASCHALSNRASAFREAILEIKKLFDPEFSKDDDERGSEVTEAQHNKIKKKILGLEQRLANPKFLANASEEIQEKTRAELEALKKELNGE